MEKTLGSFDNFDKTVIGILIVLIVMFIFSLGASAAHTEWQICRKDAPSFISDSAFYTQRPECKKWQPIPLPADSNEK